MEAARSTTSDLSITGYSINLLSSGCSKAGRVSRFTLRIETHRAGLAEAVAQDLGMTGVRVDAHHLAALPRRRVDHPFRPELKSVESVRMLGDQSEGTPVMWISHKPSPMKT